MLAISLDEERAKALAFLARDKKVEFETERNNVRTVKERKEELGSQRKVIKTRVAKSPKEKLQQYLKEIGME